MNERIFAIAHFADMAVLYLLMALAFVAVLVIVERYLFIRKLTSEYRQLAKVIETNMLAGRTNSFQIVIDFNENRLAQKFAKFIEAHVKTKGLDGLEANFASLLQIEKPRLERSLPFLATVGSNAPYIGLFGTVLGIMKAFQDMSAAGSAGNQTVMAGISAALIATAAGLLVAIPAVLAYNYFQKQVKQILGQLEMVKNLAVAQYSGHQEQQ